MMTPLVSSNGERFSRENVEFLNLAMRIEERSPLTEPRLAAWLIVALIFATLTWSILARFEIVTVAKGRVIVGQKSKPIQASHTARVKEILVREGDQVLAGQSLISLEDMEESSDFDQIAGELIEQSVQKCIAQELQQAFASNTPITRTAFSSLPDIHASLAFQRATLELGSLRAQIDKFNAERMRRKAEIVTLEKESLKFGALLPIAESREHDLMKLRASGYMSIHAVQSTVRDRIELEQNLEATKARKAEAIASVQTAQTELLAFIANTRHALSERGSKAELRISELTQLSRKAGNRLQQTTIRSPVAGTVQQLTVYASGAVVTVAKPIMVVVPDNDRMQAELEVSSSDVAFLKPMQKINLKVDAFPFTRYGTVKGILRNISRDALIDEKTGDLKYLLSVDLQASTLKHGGKALAIRPGMGITGEVITGDRRAISYFLEPISRRVNEGLSER